MARTQGHGNPDWTRDETILALELYFETDGGRLRSKEPKVEELSALLRSLPYHSEAARQETFRNAAGVAFKIQNLRHVAIGGGLGKVSNMDRAIWSELGSNRSEVARLAAVVRQSLAHPEAAETGSLDSAAANEEDFYEGKQATRLHKSRERNPKVRKSLIASRRPNLVCEVCGSTHDRIPADIREAAFEAHHLVPVAVAGERRTKLRDMALICATCHRLLHRAIAYHQRWLDISEVRAMLELAAATGRADS